MDVDAGPSHRDVDRIGLDDDPARDIRPDGVDSAMRSVTVCYTQIVGRGAGSNCREHVTDDIPECTGSGDIALLAVPIGACTGGARSSRGRCGTGSIKRAIDEQW